MNVNDNQHLEKIDDVKDLYGEFLVAMEALKLQQQQVIREYNEALEKRKIQQLRGQLGIAH